MKQRRPTVFRFILQAHAVAVSGMSAAETGGYFRALLRDLECGKGSTPQATEMIEYAKQISKVRSMAGLASAKARSESADDPNNLSPAAPHRPAPRSTTHVPTLDQWMAHAATIGLPEEEAKASFKYWNDAQWKEDNGKDVLNWHKKLAGTKARFIEKRVNDSTRPGARPGPRRPDASTYDNDDPLFGSQEKPA